MTFRSGTAKEAINRQTALTIQANGRRNDDWNFLEDRNCIPDRVANQAEQLRSSEQGHFFLGRNKADLYPSAWLVGGE